MKAESKKNPGRSTARLDRLAQLPLRLGKLKDEAALHAAIANEAARLLRAQRVLLVLQPDAATPRIAASRLPAGESAQALLQAVAPWLAEAVHSGASRLRHGPDGAAATQQRSCLVAPLPAAQGPLGCLYADIDGAAGRFEEAERALLALLAAQAAMALDNARLYNETNEALERQTATAEVLRVLGSSMTDSQPVFDAIVQSCSSLLHDSRVVLWLEEGQGLRAHANSAGRQAALALGTIPLDRDSPIGSCVLDARQLHLRDLDAVAQRFPLVRQMILNVDYHCGIFTPLVHEGRAIGGLAVLQPLPNAFNEKDESLLCTFADQAVMAIQNARLFHETQEALQRQTATTEVLQVINASPGRLEPVFEAIVQRASRLCAADGGGLWLAEGDRARFSGGQSQMPEAYLQAESAHGYVPLAFLLGREWQHSQYLLVPDVRDTDAYRNRLPFFVDSVDLGLIRTYLGVPLVDDRGQVVGVFTLVRREVNPFNAEQIALVQSFAAQAQLAMKNARLMNETREALELQQASADVLSVISSSVSDTGPVFDKILQSCERLFPAMAFNLHLVDEAGLLAVERIHATAAALAQFGREPLEAFPRRRSIALPDAAGRHPRGAGLQPRRPRRDQPTC